MSDHPNTDTGKVEPFPQQAARRPKPGKPTMAEIMIDAPTPKEGMALLKTAYPTATDDEVQAAIASVVETLEARQAKFGREISALKSPVGKIKEANAITGKSLTMGEALRLLADRGDEEAAAMLSRIDGPANRLHRIVLDLAVEADPFWEGNAKAGWRVLPGAINDTPEKLIAAFVANGGADIARLIPEDLAEEVTKATGKSIAQALEALAGGAG